MATTDVTAEVATPFWPSSIQTLKKREQDISPKTTLPNDDQVA